jgi:iron complex transport system substrate-binding protein
MAERIGRRAVLVGLVALAAACSRGVRRSAAPRVISISPSMTEAIFAVGAGEALVGRSKYCDYPPEAARLPVVGGFADPSLEAIVALSPTLVVSARGPAGPALAQALLAHGIATWSPETESIAQIEAMIAELGARLDRREGAREVIARVEASRAEVAAAIAGRPRIRAVFLFDVAPIVAAGPGSFPDELLSEAGGDNVIAAGGQYPTLDLERLLKLDPEVVLDGAADDHGGPSRVAALRGAPGWQNLRALREGRVRELSSGAVLRPGPRIGQGLVAVARALHGDGLPLPRAKAP